MLTPAAFLPRIQYLYPQLIASAPEWETRLDRCAAMGFDHVLVPDFGATGGEGLAEIARLCRAKGLALLVDMDIGALGADAALTAAHPEWFDDAGAADDGLPDPRKPPCSMPRNVPRFDSGEVLEAIADYWQQRMLAHAQAGVAGFRCVGLDRSPPELWCRGIEAARASGRSLRFLAWTPGCTPGQIEALRDCGFDATFSSAAWWDYRARWLTEEHARLLCIAPPIAFPDAPFEALAARAGAGDDIASRQQAYRRALRLAAAIGDGLLVPMGFEYGLSGLPSSVQGKPAEFAAACAQPPFDLSQDIAEANGFAAVAASRLHGSRLCILTSVESPAAVLLRGGAGNGAASGDALLIVANSDAVLDACVDQRQWLQRAEGYVPVARLWPEDEAQNAEATIAEAISLPPGDLQLFRARRLPPVVVPVGRGKQATTAAARAPRIAIEAVAPSVDGGRFPAKRCIGELVEVEADVFMDGHDKLAVVLLWRAADEVEWHETRMHPAGNDRWTAALPLTRVGKYLYAVEAWRDAFATYRDELEKKSAAGLNVSLEIEEGRLLVEAAAAHAAEKGIACADYLKTLAKSLKGGRSRAKNAVPASDAERIAALLSEPTAEAMRLADARPFVVRTDPPLRIESDRGAAAFSSWYELFPRSQSGDAKRHGTFADVIGRLPAIQAMGFDTLYFPPIHPIGKKNRKGRNNSLTPAPDDPGSPYAIGSEEGGHDAIHPQLGTIEDFRRLRDEACRHGLELALDFAIQCSPDHPWLREHPEWFDWRPDGSIRYAENPPKKYQDIVNVDFYADGAIPDLWNALRNVVLFWVKEGVRVFRVDNPHTKALPFWEWMIADVRGRHPDTIFLSEAFTRPKMMYRLAKLGFSQSYTYFTWRHDKQEFIDYLTELTTTGVREFFRPHFFVNTPDINPPFLQKSGRPGFLIRAALAATLSGLWGMYSGFELCEAMPVPGKEEYLDSEKYEIRAWDWQRPGNIIGEITQLNRIRRDNPALQSHLGVRFLPASSDKVLYFLKTTRPADSEHPLGDNVVLVAINLDPFNAHDTAIELPMWELGLADDGALDVVDLLNGSRFTWHGKTQHLRLDPFDRPYGIWRVRHQGA